MVARGLFRVGVAPTTPTTPTTPTAWYGAIRYRGGDANATAPAKLPGANEQDYQYPKLAGWVDKADDFGQGVTRVSSVPSRLRGAAADIFWTYFDQLMTTTSLQVVLDVMHCYGIDSTNSSTALVLGHGWTTQAFADQWGAIMSHPTAIKWRDRIIAVDLLNEPNETVMGIADAEMHTILTDAWQKAVTSIRATGYTGTILCQPTHWAKAMDVMATVPTWPITDPLNKTGLAVHCYYDNGGHYTGTFAAQLAAIVDEGYVNPAHKAYWSLAQVDKWSAAHPGVPIWFGEIGWGPEADWDREGRYLLSELNRRGWRWVYDNVAARGDWIGSALEPMEPYQPDALTKDGVLVTMRAQGVAIKDYAQGSTVKPAMPVPYSLNWSGVTYNLTNNPRMIAGGTAPVGLQAWSNKTTTYVTDQSGFANGTTTAARLTVATANTSFGNGVKVLGILPPETVAAGATVPVTAQIKRSGAGTVQLQIDWLDSKRDTISGSSSSTTATSVAAAAVTTLTGATAARPAGGVVVRVSVLAASAAAGETIDVTNCAIGTAAFFDGTSSGAKWVAAANRSASYK